MGALKIMPNKHIRVYELAKELNKTSKEIMAVLAEKNIEVTTHMATLEDNQAELVRGAVGSGQQEAKKEGAAPAKKKKFVVVHNPENSRDKKSPERRPQTQKSAAKPAARPAAATAAAPALTKDRRVMLCVLSDMGGAPLFSRMALPCRRVCAGGSAVLAGTAAPRTTPKIGRVCRDIVIPPG